MALCCSAVSIVYIHGQVHFRGGKVGVYFVYQLIAAKRLLNMLVIYKIIKYVFLSNQSFSHLYVHTHISMGRGFWGGGVSVFFQFFLLNVWQFFGSFPGIKGLFDTAVGWPKLDRNTGQKCHRLCDKLSQQVKMSHCDKPSKCSRLECHIFWWMYNPSNLRQNVSVVNCHSRCLYSEFSRIFHSNLRDLFVLGSKKIYLLNWFSLPSLSKSARWLVSTRGHYTQ